MQRFYPEIEALRAIAILGVLIIHLKTHSMTSATLSAVEAAGEVMAWSVLAFFWAAGFLTPVQIPYSKLLIMRTVRLLRPYIIFSLLYTACVLAIYYGDILRSESWRVETVQDLLLLILVSPTPQLYFLPYLLLITALGVALWKNLGHWGYYAMGVLTLAMYLYVDFPHQLHGSWGSLLGFYTVAFLHGMTYRDMEGQIGSQLLTTLFLFALGLGGLIIGNNGLMLYLCVTPLLFHFWRAAGVPQIFLWVGGLSGGIYVWHEPIINTGFKIFFEKLGLDGWGYAVCVFSATFLFSIQITRLVNRWSLLKFLRV